MYELMGILNLTDNSFVSESRMCGRSIDQILKRVEWMVENGARYLDIGACSSAPGNELVSEELEWKRMEEPLKALYLAFHDKLRFSIDSFRSSVIERCLNLGIEVIVNDISAGEADPRMMDVVASNGLTYIPMDHSEDPYSFFRKWAERAESKGIKNWILDPGFGFGKSVERNLEILDSFERFKDFGKPVLCACSRKRMIYLPLGLTAQNCARESFEAELKAAGKGADIIRTHDMDLHYRSKNELS